VNIYLSKEYF